MKRYRLADDGRSQNPEAPDWPLYEHPDGEWARHGDAAPGPWTYCVDALPQEPGVYEVASIAPGKLKGDPPRLYGDAKRRYPPPDNGPWWCSAGWPVFAWRKPTDPPKPRRRDVEALLASGDVDPAWLPAGYLEGLEP